MYENLNKLLFVCQKTLQEPSARGFLRGFLRNHPLDSDKEYFNLYSNEIYLAVQERSKEFSPENSSLLAKGLLAEKLYEHFWWLFDSILESADHLKAVIPHIADAVHAAVAAGKDNLGQYSPLFSISIIDSIKQLPPSYPPDLKNQILAEGVRGFESGVSHLGDQKDHQKISSLLTAIRSKNIRFSMSGRPEDCRETPDIIPAIKNILDLEQKLKEISGKPDMSKKPNDPPRP